MTLRRGLVAAFLFCAAMLHSANAQQTKAPDAPGTVTYRGNLGKTAMGGNIVEELKIGPPQAGMSRISIDVGSPGCGGGVSGIASVQGDTLLLTKDDSGNECRLTIHQTGATATVKEESCMVAHGASCDFNSLKPLNRVH